MLCRPMWANTICFVFLVFIVLPNTAQAMRTPPLILAIQTENMSFFRQLVRGDTDVNVINAIGRTAAHYAVEKNDLRALQQLIDRGADVNVADKHGKTLLDLWQRHENKEMLELLQAAGAQPAEEQQSTEEELPAEDQPLATEIRTEPDDVSTEPDDVSTEPDDVSTEPDSADEGQDLWQAAASNDVDEVKRLLAEGADAQAKKAGKAPFDVAVEAGHDALAAILLRAAAGIDGKDEKSWTPLHWAIVADDWDLVQEFLAKGADIHTGRRQSALDVAKMMGSETKLSEAFIKIVGEKGIDAAVAGATLKIIGGIDGKDGNGWTPLMWAIFADDWDLVRELIADEAKIYETNKLNALHIAKFMGSEAKLIEVLVAERGVNVEVSGTPLLIRVALEGDTDTAKLLLDHGADINVRDKYGRSLLGEAASGGLIDVVRFLVEQGADIETQSRDGSTPLIHAASAGEVDIVRYFVERGG